MALKFGVNVPYGPKFPMQFEPFDRKIFGQPYYPGQLAIKHINPIIDKKGVPDPALPVPSPGGGPQL